AKSPTEEPPSAHRSAASALGALLFRFEPAGCPGLLRDDRRPSCLAYRAPPTRDTHEWYKVDLAGIPFPAPPDSTLLLLLVPESPTSGVDKCALGTSLRILNDLRKHASIREPTYILGPNYSGAAQSYRTILESNPAVEKAVFVSGVATNPDVKKRLTS